MLTSTLTWAVNDDEWRRGANAITGASAAFVHQIRWAFALDPQTSIASAGPVLLRHGHAAIDAVNEGVLDPRDLNDYTFSA